jgi:hypothetical protein
VQEEEERKRRGRGGREKKATVRFTHGVEVKKNYGGPTTVINDWSLLQTDSHILQQHFSLFTVIIIISYFIVSLFFTSKFFPSVLLS